MPRSKPCLSKHGRVDEEADDSLLDDDATDEEELDDDELDTELEELDDELLSSASAGNEAANKLRPMMAAAVLFMGKKGK